MDTPRILVACDVRLYREGLTQSLAADDRVRVIGSATSVEIAIEAITHQPVDVVVLDIGMPDALALPRQLRTRAPATRVVAFALRESEHDVLQCAEAGVGGYVTRDGSLADLVSAIEGAVRGEVFCSARTAATLVKRVATLSAGHAPHATATPPAPAVASILTQRELQIVRLIDEGLANKEIAQRLGIGTATVKNHVHHILEKLQVTRRRDVALRFRTARTRATDLAEGVPQHLPA